MDGCIIITCKNNDDTITNVDERQNNYLTSIFPSASNPKSIKDAVFRYSSCSVKCGNMIDTDKLKEFGGYSVIRVYRDIFLAYDKVLKSLILIRNFVP